MKSDGCIAFPQGTEQEVLIATKKKKRKRSIIQRTMKSMNMAQHICGPHRTCLMFYYYLLVKFTEP